MHWNYFISTPVPNPLCISTNSTSTETTPAWRNALQQHNTGGCALKHRPRYHCACRTGHRQKIVHVRHYSHSWSHSRKSKYIEKKCSHSSKITSLFFSLLYFRAIHLHIYIYIYFTSTQRSFKQKQQKLVFMELKSWGNKEPTHKRNVTLCLHYLACYKMFATFEFNMKLFRKKIICTVNVRFRRDYACKKRSHIIESHVFFAMLLC